MTGRFLCAVVLVLCAGLCHGQAPISCAQQTTVRSPLQTGAPTTLQFVNASAASAAIWWIDASGTPQFLASLPAGQSSSVDARQSQVFMVRDAQGSCVSLYQSLASSAVVTLTAAELPPALSWDRSINVDQPAATAASPSTPPPARTAPPPSPAPRPPVAPPQQPSVSLPAQTASPSQPVSPQPAQSFDRVVFSFSYHLSAIDGDPYDMRQRAAMFGALLGRLDPGTPLLGAYTAWFSAARALEDDTIVRGRAQALLAAFANDVASRGERSRFFAQLGSFTFDMENRFNEQERWIASNNRLNTAPRPPEQREMIDRTVAAGEVMLARLRSENEAQAPTLARLATSCRNHSADWQCPAAVALSFERLATLVEMRSAQPAEGLQLTRTVIAELLVN